MKAGIKKTVLVSAMIATLGLGTAAVSVAGDHGKGCGWGKKGNHSGMMMRGGHSLADRLEGPLNLSKEQVAQIDEITDTQYKAMRDSRRAKRDDFKALMELDPTSDAYNAEVSKLAQQAGERAAAKVEARAAVRAQIAEVLTPEQREKLATLKDEMQEKWGKRRGHSHNG